MKPLGGWVVLIGCMLGGQTLAQEEPQQRLPYGRVRVLCVGVDTYPAPWTSLQYAKSDADMLGRVLRDEYGYEVTFLHEQEATRERINELVGAMLRGESAGDFPASEDPSKDVVIAFFAGHGAYADNEDGGTTAFYVPHIGSIEAPEEEQEGEQTEGTGDASDSGRGGLLSTSRSLRKLARDGEFLRGNTIEIQELVQKMTNAQVKHCVLIFDSCFSGFAMESLGARANLEDPTASFIFEKLRVGSRVIMTAGMDDQLAYENRRAAEFRDHKYLGTVEGHGIFSGFLVRALTENEDALLAQELLLAASNGAFTETGGVASRTKMMPSYRSWSRLGGDFAFIRTPATSWLQRVWDRIVRDQKQRARQLEGRGSGRPGQRPRGPTDREIIEARQGELDLMVAANRAATIQTKAKAEDLSGSPYWQEWFTRVRQRAAIGDPLAGATMYYAFQFGIGVEADRRAAQQWAQEARNRGNEAGRVVFEFVRQETMREQVEANQQQADQGDAMTVGGALLVFHGMEEGDSSATLLGLMLTAGGLADIFGEPKFEDHMSAITKYHEIVVEELSKSSRARDRDRLDKALNDWKLASNRIKDELSNDFGDDLLGELGESLAARMSRAVAAVENPPRSMRGVPIEERLHLAMQRYEELLAAFIARKAAQEQE